VTERSWVQVQETASCVKNKARLRTIPQMVGPLPVPCICGSFSAPGCPLVSLTGWWVRFGYSCTYFADDIQISCIECVYFILIIHVVIKWKLFASLGSTGNAEIVRLDIFRGYSGSNLGSPLCVGILQDIFLMLCWRLVLLINFFFGEITWHIYCIGRACIGWPVDRVYKCWSARCQGIYLFSTLKLVFLL